MTLRLHPVLPLIALTLLLAETETFLDFEDFLQQYQSATDDTRTELATIFIEWQKERGGFPIIENDGSVVFFYLGSGSEKRLSITGDFRPRSFYNVYWDEAGALMTQAAAL